MAYNIINSNKIYNNKNKYIDAQKYAILEKDGQLYLQLKLRNKSEFTITKFTLKYINGYEEKEYHADNLNAKPNEIFFNKTLIPLELDDFEFIEITDIKGKKEKIEKESKEKYNKKIIPNKVNKPVDESKLQYYSHYRIIGIMLIIFFFKPVYSLLSGEVPGLFENAGIGTILLYIFSIIFCFGGLALFIFAAIKSFIAKDKGVYDYRYNTKNVVHTILISLVMIIAGELFFATTEGFAPSSNTSSTSSANQSIIGNSSSTSSSIYNSSTYESTYFNSDLELVSNIVGFEIPEFSSTYQVEIYSSKVGEESISILFSEVSTEQYDNNWYRFVKDTQMFLIFSPFNFSYELEYVTSYSNLTNFNYSINVQYSRSSGLLLLDIVNLNVKFNDVSNEEDVLTYESFFNNKYGFYLPIFGDKYNIETLGSTSDLITFINCNNHDINEYISDLLSSNVQLVSIGEDNDIIGYQFEYDNGLIEIAYHNSFPDIVYVIIEENY